MCPISCNDSNDYCWRLAISFGNSRRPGMALFTYSFSRYRRLPRRLKRFAMTKSVTVLHIFSRAGETAARYL